MRVSGPDNVNAGRSAAQLFANRSLPILPFPLVLLPPKQSEKLTPKHPGLVVAGREGLPDAREPGLLAHDVVLRLGADRSLGHPLHEAVQGLHHAAHVPLGGDSIA